MTHAPSTHAIAPRHKPGRGSQVRPDERRAIQQAHLVDGLTRRALADRFGRTRETIAGVLKGDDFERLCREVQADLVERVQRKLRANGGRAADRWIKAVDKAAEKGDHKPAKDLLLHTGLLRPIGEGNTGNQVIVHVGLGPDCPGMVAPSQAEVDAAIALEEAREAALRQPDTRAK